jgi:hypothetical protein
MIRVLSVGMPTGGTSCVVTPVEVSSHDTLWKLVGLKSPAVLFTKRKKPPCRGDPLVIPVTSKGMPIDMEDCSDEIVGGCPQPGDAATVAKSKISFTHIRRI